MELALIYWIMGYVGIWIKLITALIDVCTLGVLHASELHLRYLQWEMLKKIELHNKYYVQLNKEE